MKFKRGLLAFAGLFTLALAACSTSTGDKTTPTTPADPTATTTTTSQTPAMDLLTFVGNEKIRVDVMDENLGVRFSYGNEAITNKTDMALNTNSGLSISGTATVETLNFVIVTVNTTKTSVVVAAGIEKEYFTEYVSTTLPTYLTGAKKVYVAISTGDVKWTKNLNAELDTSIGAKILK